MHSNVTHVIYWDPNEEFSVRTKEIINGFFADVAHDSGQASNVFGLAGQYTDASGHAAYSSVFGGDATDKNPYLSECIAPVLRSDLGPPYTACLFDSQLKSQLSTFIGEQGLPTGPTQLYFLLLPHKVATCFNETPEEELERGPICSNNFFCAYHTSIAPDTANEIIYADIPFSLLDTEDAKGCQVDGNTRIQQPNPDNAAEQNSETRFADVALKYISHEYIEAVTDPLVGSQPAWTDINREEIGDKCNAVPEAGREGEPGVDAHAFTPTLGGLAGEGNLFNQSIDTGSFYLQSEWDNGNGACLMQPTPLGEAAFTPESAQTTVGSPVAFSGTALDHYGGLEFNWTFGDGTTGTGQSPSHTFAAAGVYTVTMTPKDGLTNSTTAPVSHVVTVSSAPAATLATPAAPNVALSVVPDSSFPKARAALNANTGAITFTTSVLDPGTFSWLVTFQNGKFGAFMSSNPTCKAGFVKLSGKCRPAKIVFAKGRKTVVTPGSVTFTLKPSGSALKALKSAFKQRKGLPVTMTLTFQSSLGGSRVSRTQSLTIKLKKK